MYVWVNCEKGWENLQMNTTRFNLYYCPSLSEVKYVENILKRTLKTILCEDILNSFGFYALWHIL